VFDSPSLPPALVRSAREAAGDPEAALRLAPDVAEALGRPGGGNTRHLWRGLAELGAIDLTVARTLEPDLDARAILDQAGSFVGDPEAEIPGQPRDVGLVPEDAGGARTWGVYAAESPDHRLEANQSDDGRWRITGHKPWCSLAGSVSNALVTAWTSTTARRLFAVDLASSQVRAGEDRWVARGLSRLRTSSLEFDAAPAAPVGDDEWYFTRSGFAFGGIGVAAVWWGAACKLAAQLESSCRSRTPDQIAQFHLGQCSLALEAAQSVLADAAHRADALDLAVGSTAEGSEAAWATALRVRGSVHRACEVVLTAVGHTLGPGPLTQDDEYARRVADLQIYLQQYKPERDVAALGQSILDGPSTFGGLP
jgi:alkylation response protein AidB-like acyl-CoA dehydrogenase